VPKISIGDAEIYYESTGDGEPLLLVPGLGGQGVFWAQQVKDFARDFRVIVHDHRGAGLSTHSRIKYTVEQMAGDVVRLMDALGLERVHVAEGPGANRIPMTLQTQMYLGERWELLFKRGELSARVYAPAQIAAGEHHIEFPADALWVF